MNDCACKISDDRTKLLSACGLHYAWARQHFGEAAREEAIERCAKVCEEQIVPRHQAGGDVIEAANYAFRASAGAIRALALRATEPDKEADES